MYEVVGYLRFVFGLMFINRLYVDYWIRVKEDYFWYLSEFWFVECFYIVFGIIGLVDEDIIVIY